MLFFDNNIPTKVNLVQDVLLSLLNNIGFFLAELRLMFCMICTRLKERQSFHSEECYINCLVPLMFAKYLMEKKKQISFYPLFFQSI